MHSNENAIEIIPATSVTLPLIGKYLVFNMIMVTLSVIVTIVSLGIHFRTPPAQTMPKWVKLVFLIWLPKLLMMERQPDEQEVSLRRVSPRKGFEPNSLDGKIPLNYHQHRVSGEVPIDERIQKLYYSPQVIKAFENIVLIAEMLKKNERDDKLEEDWKYVAAVLDRFFLLSSPLHVCLGL
ncbi:Neurotransmitter-gated ion-channel transmembrane region [Oesophagostomum dentatum]|uniref:Neurotransmitter-gated ion-channel transmembrane region n=1 Tax=Oesophagostomum dentatum TaxID=61180 RepID=A0A0B1T8G5_OESDE|nr:Neurotransmitter-gated ion-channel transmembrane region [Oesophagostomum dentatum]